MPRYAYLLVLASLPQIAFVMHAVPDEAFGQDDVDQQLVSEVVAGLSEEAARPDPLLEPLSAEESELAAAPDASKPPLLAQTSPKKRDGAVSARTRAENSGPQGKLSQAERITDLKRSIEADQKALQEIQASLENPQSDYHQAEAEFKELHSRVEETTKRAEQVKMAGPDDESEKLLVELGRLQDQWRLAKDRFDLCIQERKTVKEKLVTLQERLRRDQETLDQLTGAGQAPEATAAAVPSPGAQRAPDARPAAGTMAEAAPLAASQASEAAPPTAGSTSTGPAGSLTASLDAAPSKAAQAAATSPAPEKPPSKELIYATADAQQKEEAALVAEQQAQSVADRMELLRKDIELERTLLATARQKADIAEQTRIALDEEYRAKALERVEAATLQQLRAQIAEVQQRFRAARTEGRNRSGRLDQLQSRYAALQAEQIIALQEAEHSRLEADSARQKVERLRNPFTTRNALQWLIDHGPRIAFILLATVLALWLSRLAERRIVEAIVRRGGFGKRAERENRAQTLVSVFHNAASVSIMGGSALMVLDAVGAPITALMGGAAVFGLAIAFGAQNLIKDYFYGFMILLEQQYTINDVVKIADISGQVERITLRMTVLRDLEGRVHFIPHGQINATTNMTHGWSRALFDVGIAYKEDADRVMGVIQELGQELRRDPKFAPLILEDLTMLGVDGFGESAVMIKFFVKTRPLKQWDIKREMLRRMKCKFDELGIEIPFPHRSVYHRHELSSSVPDCQGEHEGELPRRISA